MSGTAYAASAINGLYKGREIVKVKVNGKEVQSKVPGQLINGTTMLPLRAVAEALGAQVNWDDSKQIASIVPAKPAQELTLAQLNKIGKDVGLVRVVDMQGRQAGTGSAFITQEYLVTNWHLIEDGATSRIHVDLGRMVYLYFDKSEAVFINKKADLAAFKLPGFTGLKLNTNKPKKGDIVYALGYPGTKFTLSEGNVLAINGNNITHDAAIDHGSSGGVLIDSSGNVIGITDGGDSATGRNNAIQAKLIQDEINKLKEE
nr:trypsin-like peptidase domain-containing protein [Paenibacillus oenotherae]